MPLELEQINLRAFRKRFATNDRRREIFQSLVDELGLLRSQCQAMRVLVFGSYITDKDEPGDVDVLVSGVPRQDIAFEVEVHGFARGEHPDVDLFWERAVRFPATPERLIERFNRNASNRESHIEIVRVVEVLMK